jgi:predicted Zn finger-like uncharacterized protein
MDVRCEKCGTEYEFDENRIGANGVTVKCTACGFVFKVRRTRSLPPRATTTIGKGPQGGKEWLVRKPDGQMIAFRELTTLQKWIVEGRIGRDDEISKNGETWKRLGNIMELEPFFSVYEKARTLNTLMNESVVELRGSEVLSASNPIPQPQPLPPPANIPTIPATYSSASLPTAPATNAIPSVRGTMPVPPQVSNPAPLPLPLAPPGNGMGKAPPPPQLTPPAEIPALIRSNHRPPQPAAIPDLSIPIDDARADTSKSDIVSRFQRSQRRKTFGWVMVLLMLACAGGGAALAMYGPEDNPVKAFAIEHGLIPARRGDDGAMRLVEEAQTSTDLDTLQSLEKAAGLLEKAAQLRKGDPQISAERALVLALQAGAYKRWAKDVEATDAKLAEEKAKLAEPLLKQAFEIATAAQTKAPEALEPLRALAAYHLLQKDTDGFARTIEWSKAGMEKIGRIDPSTLYLEATFALDDPDPAGVDKAKVLLEQAVTARPTMNAARVMLARVHYTKATPDLAKAELDKVLVSAPAHEEAKRLLEKLTTPVPPPPTAAPLPPAPPPPEAAAPPPATPPPPAKVAEKKEGEGQPFEWWMARGDSLRERDRTQQALDAYGRAAELRASAAEPHVGKGWCFLDLDKPHLALAAFDRAIKANARYAMAYYGMAESHRALGDTAKAIAAYEQFIDRAPAGPDRASAEKTLARLKTAEKP